LIEAVPDEHLDGASLTTRLLAAYRNQVTAAVLDHAAIDATNLARSGVAAHLVPHFDRDLHSLADVAEFAARLAQCPTPAAAKPI
jgi:hypothetical protein